jgi:hypothetical protein
VEPWKYQVYEGQKQKDEVRHYLYKTTCQVNGKYYIGVHSEKRPTDGYIGCGIVSMGTAISLKKRGVKSALIDSVVKYGYSSFKKEIIDFFDNENDAYRAEANIVNEDLLRDKMCLNSRIGGVGGVVPSTTKPVSIIDCKQNKIISFKSRSECQSYIGVLNMSGKTRLCKYRYVLAERAEPIRLFDRNGEPIEFLDIFSCRFILGLRIDKVRLMLGNKIVSVGKGKIMGGDRYWSNINLISKSRY